MIKDLTKAQQAAIYFHVVAGCNEWVDLFQIAEGKERYNNLKDSAKGQTVSRWKNSDLIQQGIADLKYRLKIQEEEKERNLIERLKIEASQQEQPGAINEKTNFLDRDEFLAFLNTRANEIQDDKLRNDILKMLSDNLRYKDTERDENNEIQRFYTPVICENCPIYIKCSGCSLSECPKI